MTAPYIPIIAITAATGMDLGMALGPLIGWSIVHFSLPTYLIFITGAVFYILGALITRGRTASIAI